MAREQWTSWHATKNTKRVASLNDINGVCLRPPEIISTQSQAHTLWVFRNTTSAYLSKIYKTSFLGSLPTDLNQQIAGDLIGLLVSACRSVKESKQKYENGLTESYSIQASIKESRKFMSIHENMHQEQIFRRAASSNLEAIENRNANRKPAVFLLLSPAKLERCKEGHEICPNLRLQQGFLKLHSPIRRQLLFIFL